MRIDILTLFPEMFSALDHSIIKRAKEKKLIEINLINFRDYTADKHKRVDDTCYSGGAGMVISAQPVVDCVEAIDPNHEAHRIFLTPAAPILTQNIAKTLSKHKRLLLLCGHYEGVDQRAIDLCFDKCLSIGEYVLTGGEIPAMVVVDSVVRLIPNVISAESLKTESYSGAKKHEHPHYTRPRNFRNIQVPEVLFSGNHAEIEKWKSEN